MTADLRALFERATPGPWEHNGMGGFCTTHPDHQRIDNGSGWRGPSNSLGHCNDGEYVENVNADADAALIVAAVNALPSLLDKADAHDALMGKLAEAAKDWRHNAYSRVLFAELHDSLLKGNPDVE